MIFSEPLGYNTDLLMSRIFGHHEPTTTVNKIWKIHWISTQWSSGNLSFVFSFIFFACAVSVRYGGNLQHFSDKKSYRTGNLLLSMCLWNYDLFISHIHPNRIWIVGDNVVRKRKWAEKELHKKSEKLNFMNSSCSIMRHSRKRHLLSEWNAMWLRFGI